MVGLEELREGLGDDVVVIVVNADGVFVMVETLCTEVIGTAEKGVSEVGVDVMFTETSMRGGNWAASWATALEDDWAFETEEGTTVVLIDGGIEEDCTRRTGDEIVVLELGDVKGEE